MAVVDRVSETEAIAMAIDAWLAAAGEPLPPWAYGIVRRAYEMGRDDEAEMCEASIRDME